MHAGRIFVIGCVFGAAACVAHAQDAGRVGLTTGYPASIGIQWHISDHTAIRPEISFTTTSSSSQSLIDATSDFSSFGTGVSVLFFSPLRDNLKLYVAPRFGYNRTSGTTEISESNTDIYSIGASFGGHYALGRRFALFGEAGFQYSHQNGSIKSSTLSGLQTTSHGDSAGTRTGVGVVIYF